MNFKRKLWTTIALFSFLLMSSGGNQQLLTPLNNQPLVAHAVEIIEEPMIRSEAMLHTAVQIKIYHPDEIAQPAMDEAFEYMEKMEALMSTNKKGSDVYNINQAAGVEPVEVSAETFTVIKRALEIAEESGGLFDITIGPLTNLWAIGSEDARVPSQAEIDQVLGLIDYNKVVLDEENQTVMLEDKGMALELGGISKGYIGSGVVDILAKHGVTTAIINLGGNVAVMGTSPSNSTGWNVGVQDPDETRGEVVGASRMKDGAVVTSGIYERTLQVDDKVYHHILDPRTGYPLETDLSGVTIFAPSSFEGDAYSTAIFMMGKDKGMEHINNKPGFEVAFIDQEHGVYLSEELKDNFELLNDSYHIVE